MPDQFGEKQHEPTQHRREQARARGQVARSADLSSALLLLAGLGVLWIWFLPLAEALAQLTTEFLSHTSWQRGPLEALDRWQHLWRQVGSPLLLMLMVMFVAGVVIGLIQTRGFLFVPSRAAPDWTRLDPLAGLRRIFSLAGMVQLGFGIFKVIVVGVVGVWSLYQKRAELLALWQLELPNWAWYLLDVLFWTTLKIAVVLLVLALLDYGFQLWRHEQQLRMTTQELREEMRELLGDPHIIARRRQVQRQLVLNRISAAVPQADVTVTNPTELAVSLKYDPEKMNAPVVVAKGAGYMAQRIRQLSLQHGVPVVERKELAQALYKQVEVNQPVPPALYKPVAEVLRYVYELQGKPIPGSQSL